MTSEETLVGWGVDYSIEQAEKCPDRFCIKICDKNRLSSASSMFGGGLYVRPKNGEIEVVIENLAYFAITVDVYRE